jgi:hypothetical protein
MIEAHHHDLAAVIMEPFQRLIVPQPGFLQGVREITARLGVPLVFDEIVTGLRFAYGGAQQYYGVVPDLAAFGKIVGGGFPLAAVAGRRDIMRHFSHELDGSGEFVQQGARSAAIRSRRPPASPPWRSCGSPARTRGCSPPAGGSSRGSRQRPGGRGSRRRSPSEQYRVGYLLTVSAEARR